MCCINSDTSNFAVNAKQSGLCRNGPDLYDCCREIGWIAGREGTRYANESHNDVFYSGSA